MAGISSEDRVAVTAGESKLPQGELERLEIQAVTLRFSEQAQVRRMPVADKGDRDRKVRIARG
jgi:hypothetical protein